MNYESTLPSPDLRCLDQFRPKERKTAKLLKIVGLERFLELQDVFGGGRVWIPRRRSAWPCGVCSLRDRCIRSWHAQGIALDTLVHHLKLSPVTLKRIIRHGKAAQRQTA